jgi:hypothetical protein
LFYRSWLLACINKFGVLTVHRSGDRNGYFTLNEKTTVSSSFPPCYSFCEGKAVETLGRYFLSVDRKEDTT